jgi:hypothetical protein
VRRSLKLKCSSCGFENAPGIKFCGECGQSLAEASKASRLRDLGECQIKGLSDPLHVFELEGVGRVRTGLDLSRARGFTKFVGRQSEMATLEAALEQAIAGNAQVVGVVAEGGTGKSRLCYEFAERCRAREIPVYEAHGVAHGKAVSLLPILEFFQSYFGITEHDTSRAARDKIAGRAAAQLAEAGRTRRNRRCACRCCSRASRTSAS